MGIARALGKPTGTRNRKLVDVLQPLERGQAHSRSLSHLSGMGAQEWHVDFAHKTKPAHYLVLGCLSAGSQQACTELLERQRFLSATQKKAARAEPFLIRNGRHSFYGSILEGDEKYLRFDPGCMQGATKNAQLLMAQLMDSKLPPTYSHPWQKNDLLVINNWRMLHRRADATSSLGRTLLRITILEGY